MNPWRITFGYVWEPMFPPALICGLGMLLLLAAVRSTFYQGPGPSPFRRWVLLTPRVAFVVGLCLLLLQPMEEIPIPRPASYRTLLVGLDTSASMSEADGENHTTRLDTARHWLEQSGLLHTSSRSEVRIFSFSREATRVAPAAILALKANGDTTLIHASVAQMLETVRLADHSDGLFLFTDGHDFGLTGPMQTGALARVKHTPIYPVPLGSEHVITDVSVRIASSPPYTFVKQQSQLQAVIRVMGCENRRLRVELRRAGQVTQEQWINTGTDTEHAVSFDASEDAPGQYEYEIRVPPLAEERDPDNNSAFTYLNVTDAKIPVLLLEGQPNWDSTFLLRTLSRNGRMDLQSVVAVTSTQKHVTSSKEESPAAVKAPQLNTRADFHRYPLIILGQRLEKLLSSQALTELVAAVRDQGSSVVLIHGHPTSGDALEELEPGDAADHASGPVRLSPSRGGSVLPSDLAGPNAAELPALPVLKSFPKPKPLVSVEALASDGAGAAQPAVFYRRVGKGQVLSFAVEGLWKWSLNKNSLPDNNAYDRLWNQILTNLLQQSGIVPGNQVQLTVNSANIVAGEKAYLNFRWPKPQAGYQPRLRVTDPQGKLQEISLEPMNSREGEAGLWRASVVGDRPGRYLAEVILPDQKKADCHFAVSAAAEERSETTPDLAYLQKLAEASGGQMMNVESLKQFALRSEQAKTAEENAAPALRRVSAWDFTYVFYALAFVMALEWFLRRRWGWV